MLINRCSYRGPGRWIALWIGVPVLLCLAFLLYLTPAVAKAENLVWYGLGDPRNTWELADDPFDDYLSSLFPATPSGNTVYVYGDVPNGNVYGGLSRATAAAVITAIASNNSVQLSGGTETGAVYGGRAFANADAANAKATAIASNNSVQLSGGMVTGAVADERRRELIARGNVYGGWASANAISDDSTATATATASNNMVQLSGGMVMGAVYGGWAEANATSDDSTATATATANNNMVQLSGVTETSAGGVTFFYVSDRGNVYGGWAEANANATATAIASNNRVQLSGGMVTGGMAGDWRRQVSDRGDVYGGWASANASSYDATATAIASNNSVQLSGGTQAGNVYGGWAEAFANAAATATASNNSVQLSGGTVTGDVYGGVATAFARTSDPTAPTTAIATNNSVTLSGTLAFNKPGGSGIYGGFATGSPDEFDAFSGNRLNLWDYQGHDKLAVVAAFEFYDFLLPANLAPDTALLSADIIRFGGNNTNVSEPDNRVNSQISSLRIMGGGVAPQAGQVLTLLRADTLNGDIEYNGIVIDDLTGTPTIEGQKGVFLHYTLKLSKDDNGLYATVLDAPSLDPRTKSLGEGQAAALTFANQGADLLAGQGMEAAQNAARSGLQTIGDLATFAVGQAGTARYQTGSHVDLRSFSLLAGLSLARPVQHGNLLVGAFFEAGWGNYDSHNSFAALAPVAGTGDIQYQGGGVLGRFEFASSGQGTVRVEASLRAGRSRTSFSSSDLLDASGAQAEYESRASYFGAHLGLGYVWKLGGADKLDFSLAYFWTRQQGNSVNVVNDSLSFTAANSHRLRAGVRYSIDFAQTNGSLFTPYLGLAYEHEFDGRARARAYGLDLDAPDLKGGTGVAELGASFKPFANGGLSLELAVRGYLGQRQGVSGGLAVKYEF